MHYTCFVALAALSAILALVGCESSNDIDGNVWQGVSSNTSGETTNTDSSTTTATVDAVAFSSLNWSYGGFNGSAAALSSARIGNFNISGNKMTYSWTGDTLSSWGLGNDQADALCCLFVKKADGTWVGGKFDWISTSRTSRTLEHVTGGYNGWTLSGVPNPCEAAFVIVSKNGSKRTNVIAGSWQR